MKWPQSFTCSRSDPKFSTTNIPKLVGGVDEVSGDLAQALYAQVVPQTVRIWSAETEALCWRTGAPLISEGWPT